MPDWQRSLIVYVDVSEAWLLEDTGLEATNDNVVASDGWKEIEADVWRVISGIYRGKKDSPTFDTEWAEVPQKKE